MNLTPYLTVKHDLRFQYATISGPFHIMGGSILGRAIIEYITISSIMGGSVRRCSIMGGSICAGCVTRGCVSAAGGDSCDPSRCAGQNNHHYSQDRLWCDRLSTHCMGRTNKRIAVSTCTPRTCPSLPGFTPCKTLWGHCSLGDHSLCRSITVPILMLSSALVWWQGT